MVEVAWGAPWFVIDTAPVELEAEVRSVDGNSDWPVVLNLALEIVFTAGSDVDIAGKPPKSLGVIISALASAGLVWVVSLGHELAVLEVDDVLEGHEHEATIAALIIGIAVDKVGLGHGDKLVVLGSPGTFNGADGGESPAGAAAALVLDGGDGALVPPVERFGVGLGSAAGATSDSNGLADTEESTVLSRGKSSELVHGELERVASGVVALDGTKIREPDTETEVVLVTSEELVGGAHPVKEGALLVWLNEEARSNSKKSCEHVR